MQVRYLGRRLQSSLRGHRPAWESLPGAGLVRARLVEPPRPARLVLDLVRGRDGIPLEEPPPLSAWESAILEVVTWLGPLPVALLVRGARLHPQTAAVVRFLRRLECPVALLGKGEGISEDLALDLVDAGLEMARIVVGGVSPATYQAIGGGDLPDAAGALIALQRARTRRSAPLELVVESPCLPESAPELPAVEGWARQVGADGFAVVPPFHAPAAPAELPEATRQYLHQAETSRDPFHCSPPGLLRSVERIWQVGDGDPGALRERGVCPVSTVRMDLHADGAVFACPFKAPAGRWRGHAVREAWERSAVHFHAVERCGRCCLHPELLPGPFRIRF